jgi:4'-phosphopantetheinyl transferase
MIFFANVLQDGYKETVYPVILAVPFRDRQFKGKEKVVSLSRHARQALKISAQKSGIVLKNLLKDKDGVPLPFNGHYWSLTHKPAYVGGVIASAQIGIDIEKIRPVKKSVLKKTAGEKEWELADDNPLELFFRYWTSKEAVLKAAATGLKDLSRCRIIQILDTHNLVINYLDENWRVEHFYFENHIASIVKTAENIQWTLVEDKNRVKK